MYMGLILAQSVRLVDCIDFSNIACGGWGSSLRSCWGSSPSVVGRLSNQSCLVALSRVARCVDGPVYFCSHCWVWFNVMFNLFNHGQLS